MKEYKFYKSSTIKTHEMPGNTILSFDIANQNKTNIRLTTELYSSRYKFPISLLLTKKFNTNTVTEFGKGQYLNILYKLVKLYENTFRLVYPTGDSEFFDYNSEYDEELSENENNKYFYSQLTSNIIKVNYKRETEDSSYKIEYELINGSTKICFKSLADNSSTMYGYKISNGPNIVELEYNSNNKISKIEEIIHEGTNKQKESIEFIYENNKVKSLVIKKKFDDDEKTISTVNLTYENDELIQVKEKYDSCQNYQKKVEFIYSVSNNTLIVKDSISLMSNTLYFENVNNQLQLVKIKTPLNEMIISYDYDYKTKIITDNYYEEYYLNKNYDLSYIKNSEGYIQSFKYDLENRYDILSKSIGIHAVLNDNTGLVEGGNNSSLFNVSNIIDSSCPGGNNCIKIVFDDVNNGSPMIIRYYERGSKQDVINFICYGKSTHAISLNATVKFLKNDEIVDLYIEEDMLLDFASSEWNFGISVAQSKKDFDEITIELTPSSLEGQEVTLNYRLYKHNYVTLFKYDEKGNITKTLTGNSISNYSFDKNSNSLINQYRVNSFYNNNIIKSVNYREQVINNHYDIYNNLITNSISIDGSRIESKTTYEDNEYITSYIDTYNQEYTYEYDDKFRLKKVKQLDFSKEIEYLLDDDIHYSLLKKEVFKKDNIVLNTVEQDYYQDSYNIWSIKNTRGDKVYIYSFVYDSLNRITNVFYVNGDSSIQIYNCDYDEKGNLDYEHYGDYKKYQYIYDDDNRLITIKENGQEVYNITYESNKIKQVTNSDGLDYLYKYDKEDRLNEINVGYVKNIISYNEEGKVVGEQNIYDTTGNESRYSNSEEIKQLNTVSFEYDLLSEGNDDLYFTLFNDREMKFENKNEDNEIVGSEIYDISPFLKSRTKVIPIVFGEIPTINWCNNYTYEKHGLRLVNIGEDDAYNPIYLFKDNNELGNKFSVFTCYKLIDNENTVNNRNRYNTIFSMYNYDEEGNEIVVCMERESDSSDTAKFIVKVDQSTKGTLTIVDPNLFNNIHFLTVNVEKNNSNYTFKVYYDGVHKGDISATYPSKISKIAFMGGLLGAATNIGQVGAIIINANDFLSQDKMNEYIDKLNEIYINNSEYITKYDMTNTNFNLNYNCISFNKTLISNNGIKPKLFIMNNNMDSLNDNFYYDKDIDGINYGRYVYKVCNQKLEYDLQLIASGTIGLRYKAVTGKSTNLICIEDPNSNAKINAYIMANGKLLLGTNSNTIFDVERPYEWNSLIITWSRLVQSSSLDDVTYNVKFYLNGELLTDTNLVVEQNIEQLVLKIGETSLSFDDNIEVKAYIEQLVFSNVGNATASKVHSYLMNNICKVNTYDSFDRVSSQIVKTSNNKTITSEYIYPVKNNVTTPRVDIKSFKINDQYKTVSKVLYDDYGRVNNILMSEKLLTNDAYEVQGSVISALYVVSFQLILGADYDTNNISCLKYKYNDYGELIESNQLYNEKFEYDNYGNITKKYINNNLVSSFEYDGIRLIKHNDKQYSYNGMYITNEKVEGVITKEYKWNGNKLIEIKDVENNKKYKYKYNINKQREIKEIYNIISNTDVLVEKVWYYYNANGMLVREIRYEYNGNTVIDSKDISYLYDQNLELYGFILDGVSYYYKKDILGNIERIYDAEGVEVALYKSSAYGVNNVFYPNGFITVSKSFIGCINPIRFKGYYYDVETGLAMVEHRYYSPELCRFIQPLDVSALNPSSINGLNLYAYANNNPIGIAYRSSGAGFGTGEGMVNSLALGGLFNLGNNPGYSNSFNIFAGLNYPQFNALDLTKDIFISLGEVGSRIAWGLTKNGRAFLDFHYSAYGINGYTALDNLPSTIAKIFKGIGFGLMALDVIEAGYYSYQNGHSFGQGALNVGLTAGKNILVYKVSTGVATAFGTWAGAKLGASLGSAAGPVGFAIGAVAGAVVGWVVDEFGDVIIDWVVGWFD